MSESITREQIERLKFITELDMPIVIDSTDKKLISLLIDFCAKLEAERTLHNIDDLELINKFRAARTAFVDYCQKYR